MYAIVAMDEQTKNPFEKKNVQIKIMWNQDSRAWQRALTSSNLSFDSVQMLYC